MPRVRLALVLGAFLVWAACAAVAPEPAVSSGGTERIVAAPVVRGERAVLAPPSEFRSFPLALELGVLGTAGAVVAAGAGTRARHRPARVGFSNAVRIPRLRGPPGHSSF